jgi:hypothetical protein
VSKNGWFELKAIPAGQFTLFRNCSQWIPKGKACTAILLGWRIKITCMPTCTWWVAPQVVFFREELPEKTPQKTFSFFMGFT